MPTFSQAVMPFLLVFVEVYTFNEWYVMVISVESISFRNEQRGILTIIFLLLRETSIEHRRQWRIGPTCPTVSICQQSQPARRASARREPLSARRKARSSRVFDTAISWSSRGTPRLCQVRMKLEKKKKKKKKTRWNDDVN